MSIIVLSDSSDDEPYIPESRTPAIVLCDPVDLSSKKTESKTFSAPPTLNPSFGTAAKRKRSGGDDGRGVVKKRRVEDFVDIASKYVLDSSDDDVAPVITNGNLSQTLAKANFMSQVIARSLSSSSLDLDSNKKQYNLSGGIVNISVEFDVCEKNVSFKINKKSSFKPMYDNLVALAKKKGIHDASIEFLVITFDGIPINPDQTPEEYAMENGDILKAHLEFPKEPEPELENPRIDDPIIESELKVQLNVRFIIDGEDTKETKKYKLKIKDPLSKIHEAIKKKVLSKNGVSSIESIKMSFDGEIMEINKTPVFYDLENDDLIDAHIRTH
eukprot:TRINITY_DN6948_c0_g1_i1.p1 TRINITY_DN6948_c0_g1~~TRINITY_DN6948_c0_g1_i1.p1  ORF type:complete len:336 (-),score=78.45 TRINITY_DN6948_c0_g1_i1:29-1015(-)